ncbi:MULTISPECIES: fatty acyl-AMP ligase [Streptomycetaceae]|uniref:Acyl-CoA synthetase n=1 Tax=Streptantibioticus cattleyicolor (strain ATCC 35852 / DSM 46488 / JCM 4925 / NBRC 14057 / NRRL 8057) TaxID=1003195 RepID=F8K1V9_STREN|nr:MULTISPECIES: fatty acyl-AMP ligase [Streptomycetaceae]AEW92433.1 acyl-CoA synthetase [Streptantibioticus cattleyicolor NRRL 8057 = DSM 46488]MYS57241.1 AMP-binding protein [Streptomyces sp. SID5468]CCB72798.1 putative fatty-acid--CoA ligase fadD26 [Streptantibioticus cattleyicolor NRRL 8057 = DSM 46488]
MSAVREARPAPDDRPLTEHLRHWATVRPAHRAFTFVRFPDPGPGGAPAATGVHDSLTWRGLHRRATAVAAELTRRTGPGERVALLLPQGLDYVAAFLGCLYARVIAVPLFGPQLPGHSGRLAAVLHDCEPACLLTDSATAGAVRDFTARHAVPGAPVIETDRIPDDEDGRTLPPPDPDDIAYLQYTSGSTRTPAGVMITHRNVVANARQAAGAFGLAADTTTSVGWLPLFHDMGLVLSVAAPVTGGWPSVLMDPVAFLQHPVRWLRLLGGYPGTLSAAPNFAYDYCARRVPAPEAARLRLDRVAVLINGSEPVRGATLERFQRAFGPAGLRPQAQCPAYGLAEATVLACADRPDSVPRQVACDRAALARGRVVPAGPAGDDPALLVDCGAPAGQRIRVTDPDTGVPLPDGHVGEIRLRGPNIGLGYWKHAGRTAGTFAAPLPGEAGEWLRTGDLGALHEGRLLVTGRAKDLIIVDGRNHYPQDIEETVQNTVTSVRTDRAAAFTVPDGNGDDDGELLVVVAEHRQNLTVRQDEWAAAERLARTEVAARHGIRLHRLVAVPPGTVPRTSSGKVSRTACRTRYLAGCYRSDADGAPGYTPDPAEARR